MPVSVVVGGQFGSEGKGKVALWVARELGASIVVRVGGTNSGHTVIDQSGRTWALRQLPASILAPSAIAVLPAGALIDIDIFLREVASLGLDNERVRVSPDATVISASDKEAERAMGLVEQIGSTGSGTGAALIRRMSRRGDANLLARDHASLRPFLCDTGKFMRRALNENRRIVVEGTQGFGLSLLHGGFYPKATSRDTTSGSFIGEAGLGPRDVDDVVLVIRAHPIRVAGDSGPLVGETTWAEIARKAGLPEDYCELTTATKKVRRGGMFDAEVVRRAIDANNPNRIVMNHFDYVDAGVRDGIYRHNAIRFAMEVEAALERTMDYFGTSPARLIKRHELGLFDRSHDIKMSVPS
jgi:adenylosuccinate synthase